VPYARIGDDALISIGQGCASLRQLNVSGCYRVGDVGVTAISKGCPLLIHLDVSVCQVSYYEIDKLHIYGL
jgi:F-box/leucine-rich repeat protein 2/20